MKVKAKVTIYFLIVLIVSSQVAFASSVETDITGHWAREYIQWAAGKGFLKGDLNDNMRPDQTMTREEYVIGLANLLYDSQIYEEIDFMQYQDIFPYGDVSEASELYYSLYELNVFLTHMGDTNLEMTDIFPGDSFRGKTVITRYEAALLARGITTPPVELESFNYKDVSRALPHYMEIIETVSNGIMRGYADQTLKLSKPVTRAEGAVLFSRIHEDVKYYSFEALSYTSIKVDSDSIQHPVFTLAEESQETAKLNSRFVNAITTLEYIDFIGYIPHNEMHLYDQEPVETLWQLKNENYANVIGNNYYLILFDQTLVDLRKTELAKEAMLHLLNQPNEEVEGLQFFLNEAKQYIEKNELMAYVRNLYNNSSNQQTKLTTGIFLAELYYENQQLPEAMALYRSILEQKNASHETTTQLIQNYAYLQYELEGAAAAIQALQNLDKQLALGQASQDKETEEFLTALLKNLHSLR